jgi:transposase-like protein
MSRGYQANELAEHAAGLELAAALHQWQEAEIGTKRVAQDALEAGCRVDVIAEAVGMSRRTFYRWISPSTD